MIIYACTGYAHPLTPDDFYVFLTSPNDPLRETFARSAELSVQLAKQANQDADLSCDSDASARAVRLERAP